MFQPASSDRFHETRRFGEEGKMVSDEKESGSKRDEK
jgi:hypothetical protein